MRAQSWIVICFGVILVDVIGVFGHVSIPCWLDYSQIPYTQIPRDLESDYGAVVKELGTGTSGSMLLVLRHADNATVAVKRFRPPASCQHDGSIRQIKLEYHLGTLLKGHVGITESLELLLEDSSSTWFLVTEFCPGSLARERVSTSLESLINIFHDIVDAVKHMHALGISHGDLKMENVLLTADGRPKLIDFGAATFSDCPTETPGLEDFVNVVPGDYGTTAYLPPDIFSQLEFDKKKADVWALGILFHVMITGSVPWSAASIEDYRYQAYVTKESLAEHVSSSHCPRLNRATIEFETCSIGVLHLLQRLPISSRDMIASMLMPEPLDRPSLQTLLA